jgi:hypothetical protein
MKTILPAILTRGVSSPALADNYYAMACADESTTPWTLAFNPHANIAAVLKDTGKVRTGSYRVSGDLANINAGEMRITLHVASGAASWKAGADRGVLSCRYVGDARPVRWRDASVDATRSDADDPFAAGAWARTAPPHYDDH